VYATTLRSLLVLPLAATLQPATFVSNDISCGIYLLTPPVFDYIRPVFLQNHSNGANVDEIWFERDVIPQLSSDSKCYVYKSNAFWSQVKTAGSAVYANRHYLARLRETRPDLLSDSPGAFRTPILFACMPRGECVRLAWCAWPCSTFSIGTAPSRRGLGCFSVVQADLLSQSPPPGSQNKNNFPPTCSRALATNICMQL